MTGLIEWGAKILKNSWDSKQNPKKSHAEFRSLNNSQKALNDIIRKIKTEIESVCVCLFIIPSEVVIRGHYQESSGCFE